MMRVLDAARTSVRDEGLPQVLLPYHLHPVQLTLVARTRGDAAVLAPLVKRAVEATGTQRAVYDIRPMTGYVSESLDSSRFALLALTAFAATSLLLAAVGLYGTLAYLIARRTREFGVRLALGASAGQIVGLVLREGALLTAVGAGVGVAGALVVARALRSLLYGVSPLDPMTLAGVAAAVAAVAVAAVCHPACRAMRLDPNRILRAE
jgi:ABC-type lipoprotein release transport system permease subunit